jgi:hypothetical protein
MGVFCINPIDRVFGSGTCSRSIVLLGCCRVGLTCVGVCVCVAMVEKD